MIGVSKSDLRRSYRWSEQVTEHFPNCADVVDRVLVLHRRRYRRLAWLHVLWFKVIGGIEIVLSVTLPLFFAVPIIGDEEANKIFLATISVFIAIAAALRTFYGWDNNWRLYRSQEFILAGLVAQWEISLLRIHQSGADDAPAQALEETYRLVTKLGEVFDHEHATMFNLVVPPDVIKSGLQPSPQ